MAVRSFDTDRPADERPLAGMGLRLVTALLLALMFAGVKWAAQRGVHVVESLFWRQLGSALCATMWVAGGPGFASLRTKRISAHVTRMGLGLTAMYLNFLAMTLLPLAEATAIGFSVPIFSVVLAALVLGEPTGKWRWAAAVAGFVGVLVVAQPGAGHLPLAGGAVAVLAAMLTASVTIVIRRLGATEAAATTVFWFAVSSLIPLGLLMPWFAATHDGETWLVIAGLSLAGGLAQLTLTGALRLAPVALVMPMDYTSLVWASLFGFFLFSELPSPWTWVGASVIIASGLVILWREHRLARASRARQAVPE